MGRRAKLAVWILAFSTFPSFLAWSADPTSILAQAGHQDLEGHAHRAYLLYLRAAEAGLPDAEFNVGIMLDSGRGVTANIIQAATWYARAASHGHRRAAYNLGQLYELGEGVPRNGDIARAWFAASGLPAAKSRGAAVRPSRGKTLKPPTLVSPAADISLDAQAGGVEFVWTSQPQSEPVKYQVEVRVVGSVHTVVVATVATSSLLATPPNLGGHYEWRVSAVGRLTGRSMTSEWSRFDVPRARSRPSSQVF